MSLQLLFKKFKKRKREDEKWKRIYREREWKRRREVTENKKGERMESVLIFEKVKVAWKPLVLIDSYCDISKVADIDKFNL